MARFILLLMGCELVRIGWYGSAALAFFTAVITTRWVWGFLIGFSIGRVFRTFRR